MRTNRIPLCVPALLWLVVATPALASYDLSKIAIGGDTAPDTGGAQHANSFFAVGLNDAGQVGFVNDLTGGAAGWGAFVYGPGGTTTLALQGETAPGTGAGTYFLPGAFVTLDGSGELSFMAAVIGGAASSGIFVGDAGPDQSIVVNGEPAPAAVGGMFDGSLNGLNFHARNTAGDAAFIDTITGGSVGVGLFRSVEGSHSVISLEGDTAPGTGGTYSDFDMPAMNDLGDVVFSALIDGGGAPSGLFRDAAGVDSTLTLAGDPAPDTGGGQFDDFLVPQTNDAGDVVFLSNVSGGTSLGGLFLHSGGAGGAGGAISAIAVDGGSTPIGGTYTQLTSLASLNDLGDIAFSAIVTGGTHESGVFLYGGDSGQVEPIVLFGESAPDSGGATFAQFGFLDLNDARQVAFQSTLSDDNLGVFRASEPTSVPALAPFGSLGLLVALTAFATISLSRRRH